MKSTRWRQGSQPITGGSNCATSEKQKPHIQKCRKKQAFTQGKLVKVRSLSCTSLEREATWKKPLHPHSHPRASQLPLSLPGDLIPDHGAMNPWGYESKWQKSRDHLVSGDREMQGTESIVTLLSLEEIFSQDMWLFPGPRWSRLSHVTKEIKSLFLNSEYKCNLSPSQNAPCSSNKLSQEPGHMVVQGFLKQA